MSTTTAPVAVPVETVTTIKPSEAMRLGRMLYPERCTGSLADGRGAVCALGATAVGLGWEPGTAVVVDGLGWDIAFDALYGDGRRVACPGDGCARAFPTSVPATVWHLNDIHDWSTEDIADWLEGMGL